MEVDAAANCAALRLGPNLHRSVRTLA